MDEALNQRSGLLGLSGVSGDMRAVQHAANEGDESACLALAVYSRRLRQAIGSLTAMLGGLDALIFTGGVGEHSAEIRADACRDLKFLGIHLDADANRQCHPDADIASTDSAARILVLTAREDLTLLREVNRLI